jgi:hypothetical protein
MTFPSADSQRNYKSDYHRHARWQPYSIESNDARCAAMGVAVDFFFAELQPDETNENAVKRLQEAAIGDILTSDARGHHIDQLIASYWRIEDAKQRRHILGLVRTAAGQAKTSKPNTKPRPDPIQSIAKIHRYPHATVSGRPCFVDDPYSSSLGAGARTSHKAGQGQRDHSGMA